MSTKETLPCDACEVEESSREAIVLSSDPMRILDLCAQCFTKFSSMEDIRPVAPHENSEEVLKYIEKAEERGYLTEQLRAALLGGPKTFKDLIRISQTERIGAIIHTAIRNGFVRVIHRGFYALTPKGINKAREENEHH